MRVAVSGLEIGSEPRIYVHHHEQFLAMVLRPGWIDIGLRRSQMNRLSFRTGQIILCRRNVERWICGDVQSLLVVISELALREACDRGNHEVELPQIDDVADARVTALVAAVNAERLAGFPSGQLFLESIEQALVSVLLDVYAAGQRSVTTHRGGLGPARLRKVMELIYEKVEEDLSLHEMAQWVGLSAPHFSEMFRKSTGKTPHQFVMRHRIERAKEMLCAAEARVLDVALACGFKTQQHFARVFRRVSGVSPTEYRQDRQS